LDEEAFNISYAVERHGGELDQIIEFGTYAATITVTLSGLPEITHEVMHAKVFICFPGAYKFMYMYPLKAAFSALYNILYIYLSLRRFSSILLLPFL